MFAKHHSPRTGAGPLVAALIAVLAIGLYLPSGAAANETVIACSPFGNASLGFKPPPLAFARATGCPVTPAAEGLQIGTFGTKVKAGQRTAWQANAPAGLMIVGASIPAAR